MADDPYVVLGLSRAASARQITDAYRALAQIYHPDRYADSPPRVRDEAVRRMQAVNVAYDELRATVRDAPAPPRPAPPRTAAPPSERERPRATPLVGALYVDGSDVYHDRRVAPLGLDLDADPVTTATDAPQCATLDGELSRWFAAQSRNASMANKLMYATWNEEQRAVYAATLGCSEVLLSSVEEFADPCPECRPD